MRGFTCSVVSVVAAALLATGCSSPLADSDSGRWSGPDHHRWQLTADGAVHRSDTLAAESAHVGADFGPGAGVEVYVRAAVMASPRVRAAAERARRMGARVRQATALDDPIFQVAPFGDMAETAAGQVGLMTSISQKLPFPGKLEGRGRVADEQTAAALAELAEVRQAVARDVRDAAWRRHAAIARGRTLRASQRLLEQFRAAVNARYEVGEADQSRLFRLNAEIHDLMNQVRTARQQRQAAEGDLNALLDRPVNAELSGPAMDPQTMAERAEALTQMPPARLLAQAAAHPAVERARRGVEAAREQHGLARLARWPDLTASVHYNAVKDDGLASSATGEDAWWMGLAINLPLDQGKYDAKERAARAGLAEAVAMLTAERNRVAREVREARDRVAVHMEHVTALRAEIVPDSRRATEAAMAAYRGGAGSYLDVIDAWRRSLQFQLMLDDHTAMLGSARADLEQALGRPVVSAARSAPEDSDDE